MVQVTQGYWLEKVKELESQLALEKARHLVLQSELDLAQAPRMARELRLEKSKVEGLRREWEKAKALLLDSELELVRVKQKAHLRETELEMALDLVRSKAMAQE